MGDVLKKVKSGDSLAIPAAAYNAFVDAAQFIQDRRHDRASQGLSAMRHSCRVRIKNATASAVARFGVLGISSVLFTPTDNLTSFQNEVLLAGVAPTAAHAGRFAVLLEPLDVGQVGTAVIDGVCIAQVYAATLEEAALTTCDAKAGDATQLQITASGTAQVLYRQSGTGTKWAVVRLGARAKTAKINWYCGEILTWSTYEPTEAPYAPGLAHPVLFDVERVSALGVFKKYDLASSFDSPNNVPWTAVEILEDETFDFQYGLSNIVGILAGPQSMNAISLWLEKSIDSGSSWSEVTATHTHTSIQYQTSPDGSVGCEVSPWGQFATSVTMSLPCQKGDRYRLWCDTRSGATLQEWNCSYAYLYVRRN